MAAVGGSRELPQDIVEELAVLVGEPCTLQRLGTDKSLSIGFGSVDASGVAPHGEWEIGTYDCSWRVVREGKILCGSQDAVDSAEELQENFARIRLGEFASLKHLSEYDLRVRFSCGTSIDVLSTISDDDEVLHVFFPRKRVAAFSIENGWAMGPSDKPWPPVSG